MQDCLTYLHQMDAQLKARTTILLVPDGTSIAPSCTISLLTCFNLDCIEDHIAVGSTTVSYPNRDTATFEGALLRAVYDHDRHLSEAQMDVMMHSAKRHP
jgi:hypothetical protein